MVRRGGKDLGSVPHKACKQARPGTLPEARRAQCGKLKPWQSDTHTHTHTHTHTASLSVRAGTSKERSPCECMHGCTCLARKWPSDLPPSHAVQYSHPCSGRGQRPIHWTEPKDASREASLNIMLCNVCTEFPGISNRDAVWFQSWRCRFNVDGRRRNFRQVKRWTELEASSYGA